MTKPKNQTSNLPRRFFKQAAVCCVENQWQVELDQRPIRTVGGAPLRVGSEDLAGHIAAEWNAQTEQIDPATMPLTRLVNVAIDRTPSTRETLADELARYAGTDLICHLADTPVALRERQDAGWRRWRDWAGQSLGIVLVPVEGIIAAPQPTQSLAAARDHALSLDDVRLTALVWACTLYGSAVLALAVERGELDASEAFELSRIDEAWQVEQWGEDDEAQAIVEGRRADAGSIGKLFAALAR